MTLQVRRSGFVQPIFFEQLSRVDKANSDYWRRCFEASRRVFELRANNSGFISSQASIRSASLALNPRVVVRPSDDSDPGVKLVRENGSIVLRFLKDVLKRNSFDDKGSDLEVYLHVKTVGGIEVRNNAEWYKGAVHIADCDRPWFTSFTTDVDILAHEVGHGIVVSTSKFEYRNQSGALNESWADVLGSMVKQYMLNQTAEEADWLIGDALVEDMPVKGVQALRSMKAPGTAYELPNGEKDDQVRYFDQNSKDSHSDGKDNGGVHKYSGIPNHAFYRFALAFPKEPSWRTAGQVWYRALLLSNSETTFGIFANATLNAAHDLPQKVQTALEEAWGAVGIKLNYRPSPSLQSRVTWDDSQRRVENNSRLQPLVVSRPTFSFEPPEEHDPNENCECVIL